jgi:electron transfer flavoprotein alpha subunit
MSGGIWVVTGGGDDDVILDEAHRVADLLDDVEDRPDVVAVSFEGTDDREAIEAMSPDQVVQFRFDDGDLPSGAASTADRVGALATLVDERDPRAVLTESTPDGDDLVARLARRIGGGCVTDCLVRVREGRLLAGRVVYEGRAYGEFAFENGLPVVSVNTEVLGTPTPREGAPTTTERSLSVAGSGIEHVETLEIPEQDLSRAQTIVAGGQGLGSADGFETIEDLAGAIGGAMGSSRPPADDGWVPYDRQIGVTGKEIDTELYIACAISGDPYHMRTVTSEHLLAVNTDPDARIFNFADLGIVGDVYEYGPALADAIRDAQDGDETAEAVEADGGIEEGVR